MKFLNFSQEERDLVSKLLRYAPKSQVFWELLPQNTLIIKTDNFFTECKELDAYTSGLGLENGQARLVFTSAKGNDHKILLNADTAQGPVLAHVLLIHLIHLTHLIQYSQEHGNIHRYGQEEAIANAYYEFLLWTKFRAMTISSKANALLIWHDMHGEENPPNGCYSFSNINFHGKDLESLLEQFLAENKKEQQKMFWPLLEHLVAYLGGLACYQRAPNPQELDQNFPETVVEQALGLSNTLALYSILLRAENYTQWKEEKQNIRQAVVALQQWTKNSC